MAFAPVGVLLLLAVPLLAYVLYPPTVKERRRSAELGRARSCRKWVGLTAREIALAALVLLALVAVDLRR